MVIFLSRLESMNDLAAEPMEPDTLADIANGLRQIESSCEVDMRLEEHVNYLVDEEYHTPASQFVLNLTSAAQLFARAASEDGRRIQLAYATDMVAALFHLFYFMARQLQLIPNCATINWVNFHCSHQFKEMVGATESLLDRCFEPLIFWDMDDSIFEAIGDCYRTSLENANKFLDCCIGDQWCAIIHPFAIPPLRSEPLRPAISILCQASTAITFSRGCKPSFSLGLLVDAEKEYDPAPYNYTLSWRPITTQL
nr:uncharacterized protein LOC103440261 isoform X2 [Malus domestica]XP_028964344.1 uncharacterized protein LOC103440261 isoform X2 [Malus domestica]XP_028964345.1 uncharacterized protein LOC103440261 isoform X2 [Malus domestica]